MRTLTPLFGILVTFLLAAASAAGAAEDWVYPRRVYTTRPAGPTPPVVDGDLGDACWDRVEWATDFVQWEPQEGVPPSEQTAFKILYDEHALYIAYRAYDSEPQKIDDILARRDWFPGDWVEINIDSRNDRRTGFSFTSSVSGTRGDEFISEDGNEWNGNWDPIWKLRTRIDDRGWTAEVRIPFSQLRYTRQDEQVWGIQVQRRLFRKEERSLWQPRSKDETGWVSHFGELRGIRGIQAGRRVELLPYTVARTERSESVDGDPFRDGSESDLSVGLDGKLGVAGFATLDFTVNPDFGQIEADPSEVNLSAFETYFQEKRPFFIEGNNIFDFRIAPSNAGGSFTSDNLFYSRRIGLRPHHRPDLAGGEHADVPENTSILGAAKLTGKTANGLSIGVLESLTAREVSHIAGPGGSREETAEPLTGFFAGRVEQDIAKGDTRIGGMVTAVNRNLDQRSLYDLHRAAYSGGMNLFHYWGNRSWFVSANLAASRVEGRPEAILATQTASARYYQRPDNDYAGLDSTRTSLSGHAGSARLVRAAGSSRFRFETGVAWRSPGFETNDLGYLRSADEINQFSWVGYSVRNRTGIFRRFSINANQWLDWDWGGTNLSRRANLNANADFVNNWSMGGGATRTLESISNTELRGGPSSRWPGQWDLELWVNSARQGPVFFSAGGNLGSGDKNSFTTGNVWLDLSVRPANALQLTLSPSYTRNRRELQYVGTESASGEPRYLFGRLDQKTLALTLRIDYTLSPNLTLQLYGAPFTSSGAYTDFKRITDPRAGAYADRFHTFDGTEIAVDPADGSYLVDEGADGGVDYRFDDPDFNFRDFNSNLVLRWEFQPGSLLFLVWSQSRMDVARDGSFAVGDEWSALFDTHPRNIFLVKISKWFTL